MKKTRRPCLIDPKQPRHENGRMAVIDIGSSMVRLVVYDDSHYPHLLLNHKVWCLLGKGKGEGPFYLDEARMEHAISSIEWFLWVCAEAHVKTVIAVASSAVREAENGADFVAHVKKRAGLHVEVIDGETEAKLAAIGATASMPGEKGAVIDLGGGSLDFCETHGKHRFASFPLGVLSLQERSGGDPFKAEQILKDALKETAWVTSLKGQSLLALGSGMRSLARLHMEENNYPLKNLHGYTIDAKEAMAFAERFMRGEISPRLQGLVKVWKDILPFRAAALRALLAGTGAGQVCFASFGIREGILFTQCARDVMNGDPLITFAEDAAQRDGHGMAYGEAVARFVEKILPEVEPRLLHAAALFSDALWREQANFRGRAVYEFVLGGAYVAVSHNERVRLALMSYFRHENKMFSGMKNRFKGLVNAGEIDEARKVGAALRVARVLDPGMQGDFSAYFVKKAKNGTICVEAPDHMHAIHGEEVQARIAYLNSLLDGV